MSSLALVVTVNGDDRGSTWTVAAAVVVVVVVLLATGLGMRLCERSHR